MLGGIVSNFVTATFRRTFGRLALVAALLIPLIAVSGGAANAASSRGYYVAVSGGHFVQGKTYSPDEVGQASGGGVTPMDVASGFILFDPGYRRSTYVYDSDWGDLTYLYCNGSCKVLEQWQSQVHLWVQGGTAKSWKITLNARHISGTYTAYFDYWYACAINVSGSPDHYCATSHGADVSPESGAMTPGDTLFRYFERNSYSNTEYGMVGITAHFPNASAENKDRLADVCVKASDAPLCATTGTGTSPSTHTW